MSTARCRRTTRPDAGEAPDAGRRDCRPAVRRAYRELCDLGQPT